MITMSAEAVAALRLAVADHQTVHLPVITDRAVYVELSQALTRLAGGGRYDTQSRAYVYRQDPRPDLMELTGSGVIPPPSLTRDKGLSYWATPPALAAELIRGLELTSGQRVLEPSAGDGVLVRALRDAYPYVHIAAVEPDRGRRAALRLTGPTGMHVWDGTFEDYSEFATVAGLVFDAVVMNPPFTLPGRRYAWAEHLTLAWDRLWPGGRLRAIVPASLEYGRQRPIAAARALITEAGGTWRPAPDGAFQASGTNVQTLIVDATR